MNNKMRKILIISMTGGFGHIKAGEALLDYAKENLPDISAEHIDISNINPLFKKLTIKFYDTISKKLPFIWGALYKITDFAPVSLVAKKIGEINFILKKEIKNYILNKNPDSIIFTNIVPLPLFSNFLSKKFTDIKMGVVVTDYYGHPYYNFPFLDYYFVVNEKVKEDLEKEGVSKEKIRITGIPISPKFYIKENIVDLKKKYGINNDFPVVLLIASFRLSKNDLILMVKQLLNFKQKINLIFIASSNEKFYNIVKDNFEGRDNLIFLNWVSNVDEYMKISDVVISKAGGLTVSECLTLKKPMIIVNPIPGQEEYNAEFVEKNNFGKRVKSVNEIVKFLPEMIRISKNKTVDFMPKENPCKKIFQYIL